MALNMYLFTLSYEAIDVLNKGLTTDDYLRRVSINQILILCSSASHKTSAGSSQWPVHGLRFHFHRSCQLSNMRR